MNKRGLIKLLAVVAVALACIGAMAPLQARAAEAEAADYKIYPTPHSVVYAEGDQTLRGTANVLVEDGIDADTQARLDEALELKDMARKDVKDVPAKRGVTSVLVGVKGSGDKVDAYVEELVAAGKLSYTEGLFDHNDAYVLASLPSDGTAPDQVIVLGKSTDAAYYGLTTLYQILQQTSGAKLRAFTISDYADVVTRGFIEGYYGNPWSTADRVNLMKWGGYYKMNAYVYAPKDDPKHNSNWRELYTDEELAKTIEPLAKAGNESKVRFVYALHPFMSNAINDGNYDASLEVMKQKFTQVMDHGVRQIAILADDAGSVPGSFVTRLLTDITNWLHEKQVETNDDGTLKYEGLKDTLIFCPANYMGRGETWYANLPDNAQVVSTGYRPANGIWGKVDRTGIEQWTSNSGGTAPFMWVNWPCSDNDKDVLHMGGHNEFLGSDVVPGSVKGVVLNPMQQSEPSKQAIFMNADFSWNLWTSTDHADQAWEDSFSYIDHNSGSATKGSDALKTLSGHMKKMIGGGITWDNNESSDIATDLDSFRDKLSAGNITDADSDAVETVLGHFKDLQKAAKTYRSNAGNKDMLKQMDPWVSTWEDLTRGTIAELEALKADLSGDTSTLLSKHSEGSAALEDANGHGFSYVGETKYAKVGRSHIMPMVNALTSYVAQRAEIASNPNADITTFVTSRTDAPAEGTTANAFDGNVNTKVIYKTPNRLTEGTFFGLTKTKAFTLNNVTFVQGAAGGKDFMDHAKLQTFDGTEWTDVQGADEKGASTVTWDGLNVENVYGVRIIATQENTQDAWPTISEIIINDDGEAAPDEGPVAGTVSITGQVNADSSRPLTNMNDGDTTTYSHLKYKNASQADTEYEKRDTTQPGATVTLTFSKTETVGSFTFVQAARTGNSGDGISDGKIEYQNASDEWVKAGDVTGDATQTFTLDAPVQAKAVRVVNETEVPVWWKVFELSAATASVAEEYGTFTGTVTLEGTVVPDSVASNPLQNASDGIVEANNVLYLKKAEGGDDRDTTAEGATVVVTFDSTKTIDAINFVQDLRSNYNDVISDGAAYYKGANGKWVKAGDITSAKEQTIPINGEVQATAIKVVNEAATAGWWRVHELNASREEPETPVNNENILTDVPSHSMGATVEDGSATLMGSATLTAGQYMALDLGAVRRDVQAPSTTVANAEKVYSQNGLEWSDYSAQDLPDARYIGFKAIGDTELNLNDFTVTFTLLKEPSQVSGNLGNFDAGAVFDRNVTTSSKPNDSYQNEGAAAVFDLGQTRTINSIAYYVPEDSLDFIRKGVIEVADSPDATNWTPVLQINKQNATVDNRFNTDNAKSGAPWLTHASANPGNVYTANPKTKDTEGNENDPNGTTELDVTARYLRVRITGAYSHRWTQIGEILINGGEYVSTYSDADFTGDIAEVEGKSPANMLDGDTTTVWQPQADSGSLTYHVSEPKTEAGQPYAGVRIVSAGAPSGAKVKATVYTNAADHSQTDDIELGTLSQSISEFRFADIASARNVSFTAVKNITIEWENAAPQIAEFFLMEDVGTVDKNALESAISTAEAVETDSWTKSSKQALADALANAKAAKENGKLTQTTINSITATLTSATEAGVQKYTGDLPPKVENDGNYTAESYQAYLDAYTEAEQAFRNKDDLSQADGQALVDALSAAQTGLVFDKSAEQRATTSLADAKLAYGEASDAGKKYTEDSAAAYKKAAEDLQKLLENTNSKPSDIKAATDALATATSGLVDASELMAARAEFEDVNAKLYTAESYAAYKKAFDDSAVALKNGTAEQVAAAVKALADARSALQVRPAVDLNKVIADAKTLREDDYTADSWAALKDAIAKAEAGKDQGKDQELAQAITDARAALVSVVALKADVEQARTAKPEDYTEDSIAKLNAAIEAADAVLQSGTADEVAAARAGVNDALKALVNVSALKDAIAKAEKADASQATDEQKAQLAVALDAAKALLKSGTKDEVASALNALTVATGNLGGSDSEDEKPGTDNTQKPGTDDTQKPGDKGDNKPSGGKQPGNKGSKGDGTIPQTGDFALVSALLAGGSGLACLAGATLTGRKRRR